MYSLMHATSTTTNGENLNVHTGPNLPDGNTTTLTVYCGKGTFKFTDI